MEEVTLYAIQAPVSGLVKIGSSSDPSGRFKTIQAMSPELLVMHVVAKRDGRELEKRLHKRLSDDRHHGEWFENTQELQIALIETWIKNESENIAKMTAEIITEYFGGKITW